MTVSLQELGDVELPKHAVSLDKAIKESGEQEIEVKLHSRCDRQAPHQDLHSQARVRPKRRRRRNLQETPPQENAHLRT